MIQALIRNDGTIGCCCCPLCCCPVGLYGPFTSIALDIININEQVNSLVDVL
jgi:hypothetical protein